MPFQEHFQLINSGFRETGGNRSIKKFKFIAALDPETKKCKECSNLSSINIYFLLFRRLIKGGAAE
jgi:hypothetical protein